MSEAAKIETAVSDVKLEKKGFFAMVHLGLVLALYAAAACVGLAFVYAGTAGIIEERRLSDQKAAQKELFPAADDFREVSVPVSGDPSVVFDAAFQALQGGKIIGAVIQTSRASYGGDIKILVGIGAEGKISGVKILEHKDTPGLGANAASPSYYVDRAAGIHFYDQFTGKSVTDGFVVKQDVTAISAATITSAAVSASVKAAGQAAPALFGGTE
jgi:electron transport complex protein RnfG